jgi:hypothetical protein
MWLMTGVMSRNNTTTESTDPKDDRLLFLNGRDRLKYIYGKRDYQRRKNKVKLVIQYMRKLIKL